MAEPTEAYHFRHTLQSELEAEPTETDLIALTRAPIIESIFDAIRDPNAKANMVNLERAIRLGRSTLGVLTYDRRKRYAEHEAVTKQFGEQFPLTPPINGDGERNIHAKHVRRLTREFFTGIARLEPPIDAGLEIGHQEHLGDLTRADVVSIDSLHTAAKEAIEQSDYVLGMHDDVRDRLAPRVTFEPFDTDGSDNDGAGIVEILSIHKKSPLYDITPDPDLLPGIKQLDLYARRTYAGLSRPGHTMGRRAVREYLAAQSPDQIVNLDGFGQLVPLSTSVILRARSHPTR